MSAEVAPGRDAELVASEPNVVPGLGSCELLVQDDGMRLLRRRGEEPELLLMPDSGAASSRAVLRLNTHLELGRELELEGIAKARRITSGSAGPMLVMAPARGDSLAALRGPLPLGRCFAIARGIAGIIAALHQRGITHREVRPAAFLVDDASHVTLVDLGGAARAVHARAGSTIPSLDRLPWVAPEQTSRMNRGFDRRADLYSLGAVLYSLLVGRAPFVGTDALSLVHAHIAQLPDPPSAVRPELAGVVDQLVLKLLSKRPQDRYQTARGLVRDLERIEDGLQRSGRTPNIVPGAEDCPDWLQAPQHLYGHEHEYQALVEALSATSAGQARVKLLVGEAGLGKSLLGRELQRPIAERGGVFISGNFQRIGGVHDALVAALGELVHHQLALDPGGLREVRARLQADADTDLGVLAELVPPLRLLVGERPTTLSVPKAEARNRLYRALRSFVSAFCAPGKPLVLFLDQLEWANEASLALVEQLVGIPHLLLVFAGRPEALESGVPAAEFVARLRARAGVFGVIELEPLAASTLGTLLADLLHASVEETQALTQLLSERTSGNPALFLQALSALVEEGLVAFDHGEGRWTWNMESVRRFGVDDRLARRLSARVARLSAPARQVLSTLAAMGRGVQVDHLALATGRAVAELVRLLGEAEARDVVLRDSHGGGWSFLDDRIRDAVLDTLPDERRQALHWEIAQRLSRGLDAASLDEVLFDVANHLVDAGALLAQAAWDERLGFAELLHRAGKRASDTLAFDAACRYLRVAGDALGEEAWGRVPQFAFEALLALGEAEAFSAQHEAAERSFGRCLERGKTDLELARVHRTRAMLANLAGNLPASLAAAREGLRLLGVRLPDKPGKARVALELLRSRWLLARRHPTELEQLPLMPAGKHAEALTTLIEILPAAYSHSEEMTGLVFLMMTNLALAHGKSGPAAHAFVIYGHIVKTALRDPKTGYAFGKFGMDLAQKAGDRLAMARTGMVHATLLHHWQRDWRENEEIFLDVVKNATSCGDFLYASYASSGVTMLYHVLGNPISELPALTRQREDLSRRANYEDGALYFGGARRWAHHLLGRSSSRNSWDGEEGTEADFMRALAASSFAPVRMGVSTFRLSSFIVAGDVDAALALALRARGELHALSGQTFEVEFTFLAALAASDALCTNADTHEARRLLAHGVKRLSTWHDLIPDNVAGRFHLLNAQRARLRGDLPAARAAFQAARSHARRRNEPHVWAFTAEREGSMELEQGRSDEARATLREAARAYEAWGALAKLEWLERDHENLELGLAAASKAEPVDVPLDMESVLKAAAALTAEIRLERLLAKVVDVAVENAAASRGHLVLDGPNGLYLASSSAITQDADSRGAHGPTPLDACSSLARSVVHYVARTSEELVLEDASTDPRFLHDPYLLAHPGISILCQPITAQGKRQGILYLENDLAEGAFPPERLRVMSLISTQTAISLENARLYGDMQSLTRAQSRFVPYQFLENLNRHDIAEVQLGDHVTKEMSVLFCDLRDFTGQSENLEPTLVVEILNTYFAAMEQPIVGAGGFIDAFTGDEIMALFDAEPDQAVRAGITMARALEHYNAARPPSRPALAMGIGINTGRLLLGTVGGRDRFKCGVVGNTVNLASRIEQLTKVYGSAMLIGEETHARLENPGAFSLRELDRVVVKGNYRPTTIYEVLDAEPSDQRRVKDGARGALAAARELFVARDFAAALAAFQRALEAAPTDRALEVYAQRCRAQLERSASDDGRSPDSNIAGVESSRLP